MSEALQHECGIALIRLLKPYEYYIRNYGSPLYAINKLYLLMEKQHNRGQDGAGVAVVKLGMEPGQRYIAKQRSSKKDPLSDIYKNIQNDFMEARHQHPRLYRDPAWIKEHVSFAGEVLLGHLRYGTRGKNSSKYCHPFIRQSNWLTRNLIIAGNFNMTNNAELFEALVKLGQHPRDNTDTNLMLEKLGHYLDEENQHLYMKYMQEGCDVLESYRRIQENLNIVKILKEATHRFDGGYVLQGIIGNGDAFVMRDPHGIRPVYYYSDDELVVAASERPAIQTAFGLSMDAIKEVQPGHAVVIKASGYVAEEEIIPPRQPAKCSFERIYFSRGTDADIYQERKRLGLCLSKPILKAIDYDIRNTVFSYIPNTSEVAFLGMMEGVDQWVMEERVRRLKEGGDPHEMEAWMQVRPRIEKIMTKDAKLRTFITNDKDRNDLVSMVYDTTYGVVKPGVDTLVVVDDSIVRGTTLRTSIIGILDRLGPKNIVVASSAPQIRYPDCYGIDMSKIKDFAAFEAVIALIRRDGKEDLLAAIYDNCKAEVQKELDLIQNRVRPLYDLYSVEQISDMISEILKPADLNANLKVVYQSIENLHMACPNHHGDWYFTGHYPTPGGNRVVNQSFINFMENVDQRAY